MIKRNDLATQFSLVVQQEIKNHNDAVAACNSALEAIKHRCVDIQSAQRASDSEMHSRCGRVESDVKDIDTDLAKLESSTIARLGDFDKKLLKFDEKLRACTGVVNDVRCAVSDLSAELSTVKSMIVNVSNECVGIVTAIKKDLDRHSQRSHSNMCQIEQSLLARPSEDHEHRKRTELLFKGYDQTIDHMKEHIDHISNKAFYQQKQIEALRDTIKRQEKGK